jgi:hypothetical protein
MVEAMVRLPRRSLKYEWTAPRLVETRVSMNPGAVQISQIELSRESLVPDCCFRTKVASAPRPRFILRRSLAAGTLISRRERARPNRVNAHGSETLPGEIEFLSLAKCIDVADALGLDDCCLRWVAWRRMRGRCSS